MKLSTFTIIAIFLFSCKRMPEKKASLTTDFTSIDSLSVLAKLFENSEIKNKQIVWTPGYQDLAAFSNIVSSDSLCHTSIDTTLISGNDYYVIFRTDQYEKSTKADCHVCTPIIGIASFEKINHLYHLKNFQKKVFSTGGFGEYGTVEIGQLCNAALKVTSGWTGTGADIGYEIYYDLDDFSELFSLTTLDSNGGMFDKSEANYYETVKSITDKTDSSFVVETIKLSFDSLGKKTEIKYKDRVKPFSDVGGRDIEMERLKE